MSDQNNPIGFNRPKALATPLWVFSDRKAMGDRCTAKSGMGINRLTLSVTMTGTATAEP
jgi:hypothetical protein